MTKVDTDAHLAQFVQQVARRYVDEGYKVVVEPRASDLPGFLKGFHPDMIASKDDEHVVIEVKRLVAPPLEQGLQSLAIAVEKQPGWRFDLVVYEPPVDRSFAVASSRSIESALKDATRLFSEGRKAPAFMFAWSALEAIARRVLVRHVDEALGDKTSTELLKNLVFHGFLSDMQFRELVALNKLRNSVAHGALRLSVGAKDFKKLEKIILELLEEHETESA